MMYRLQTLMIAALLSTSAWGTGGLELGVDYLYWKPFSSELLVGIYNTSAIEHPQRQNAVVLYPDLSSGVGVNASWAPNCGCLQFDTAFRWVHPVADRVIIFAPPIISTDFFCVTDINSFGTRYSMHLTMPYYTAEAFVAGRMTNLIPNICFSAKIGMLFTSVQRNFRIFLDPPAGITPPIGPGLIYNRFVGAGPAAGLAAVGRIWNCLEVSGEVVFGGHLGRKKTLRYDVTTNNLLLRDYNLLAAWVPSVNYRAQLAWKQKCRRWSGTIRLGWEQRLYFGIAQVPYVSVVTIPDFDNLFMGGPTFGASVAF